MFPPDVNVNLLLSTGTALTIVASSKYLAIDVLRNLLRKQIDRL